MMRLESLSSVNENKNLSDNKSLNVKKKKNHFYNYADLCLYSIKLLYFPFSKIFSMLLL